MGAVGHQAALVDEEHPVGELDGGHAVGHDHRRRVEGVAKAGQDLGLHERVHGGRGVIEHEHARPADERPSERDPLALTARERHTPLAGDGVEALREGEHERLGPSDPGRRRDVLGGVGLAHGDVLDDGVGEEERLLEHHADRGAQLGGLDVVGVDTADADRAGGRVGEADEQVAQRALARAGGPDDGHDLAGRHREGEVGQHRHVGLVGEADALELDRQGTRGQRGADVGLGRPGLGEHGVDAGDGDDGARHLLEEEADDSHRERQQAEQRDTLHEVAGVERPGAHLPRSDQEQHDDADVRDGIDGGFEGAADATDPQPGLPQLVGPLPHALDLERGPAEGLHHEGAVEALVRHPRHLADPLLHLRHGLLDPGGVEAVHEGERGEEQQRHRGEGGVDLDEADDREADEDEHADGEGEGVQQLGGAEDVGVGVGQQGPGRLRPVVPHRDLEVRAGDLAPQPGLGPERGERGEVAPEDDGQAPQQPDAEERQRGAPHLLGGGPGRERGHDDLVRDVAQDDGGPHRRHRVDGGPDQRREVRERLGADVADHQADPSPEHAALLLHVCLLLSPDEAPGPHDSCSHDHRPQQDHGLARGRHPSNRRRGSRRRRRPVRVSRRPTTPAHGTTGPPAGPTPSGRPGGRPLESRWWFVPRAERRRARISRGAAWT